MISDGRESRKSDDDDDDDERERGREGGREESLLPVCLDDNKHVVIIKFYLLGLFQVFLYTILSSEF